MLEDREYAKRQIRRMAGLRFFPVEPEAIAELIDALTTAPDEAAAARWVGQWIRDSALTPTPADIYAEFAPTEAIRPYGGVSFTKCATCGDTGFAVVERNGVTAAIPCACRASVAQAV